MIGYVCVGTNDLPRSAAFYDALLAGMGAKRIWKWSVSSPGAPARARC
jgi:catechol 2,3-dioxygenase-like lactoylglutathione lyase family enzyme